jgi:hypothetical protein
MMNRKLINGTLSLAALLLSTIISFGQKKVESKFSAEVEIDNTYYFNEGLYPGQERNYLSFGFTPDFYLKWGEGKYNLKATGFLRVDQYDSHRTHGDIRELYWQTVNGNREVSIGIKKIFWGVAESAHLVDIINQTDFVESFDGEQKLGEAMIHWSYATDFGTFDAFYLPYFRKRQFPGEKGRLRTPFLVNRDDLEVESSAEEFYPSFAGRWSHYIGVMDFGVSYFHGVGREPVFQNLNQNNPANIIVSYPIIDQIGLEVQATTGPVLWKLESILRTSDIQDMFALAGGLEYTFSNVKNTGIDIGIVGEYLYDDRDQFALNGLNNDLFAGIRLAFNDISSTQFLMGGIFDLERSTKLFSIEGSRRFGDSWTGAIEARALETVSQEEFTYFVRQDSFLKFSVSKFF